MSPDHWCEDICQTARQVDEAESLGLCHTIGSIGDFRHRQHQQHTGETDEELTDDDDPDQLDLDRQSDREVPRSRHEDCQRQRSFPSEPIGELSENGGPDEFTKPHHPHRNAEQHGSGRHTGSIRQHAMLGRMQEHRRQHGGDQGSGEETKEDDGVDQQHENDRRRSERFRPYVKSIVLVECPLSRRPGIN